jgi:hypothetical protein
MKHIRHIELTPNGRALPSSVCGSAILRGGKIEPTGEGEAGDIYDPLVVGGGDHGTGIARRIRRGPVLLVEQGDLANCISLASTT